MRPFAFTYYTQSERRRGHSIKDYKNWVNYSTKIMLQVFFSSIYDKFLCAFKSIIKIELLSFEMPIYSNKECCKKQRGVKRYVE